MSISYTSLVFLEILSDRSDPSPQTSILEYTIFHIQFPTRFSALTSHIYYSPMQGSFFFGAHFGPKM